MDMIYKTHQCKVLDAPAGKPIVAQVSTADVDSDGDVIWQTENEHGKGWLLDDFNKRNGRVYWMHNPWVPNLAKARAWVDGGRLLLSAEFDPNDELAVVVDRKIRGGYIDEWSVGFKPMVTKPRDGRGMDIYEALLFEVSVVNQGANYDTAVLDKMAGGIADAANVARTFETRLKGIEAAIMRIDMRYSEAAHASLQQEMAALKAKIRTCV
jgi:hypothetical protein